MINMLFCPPPPLRPLTLADKCLKRAEQERKRSRRTGLTGESGGNGQEENVFHSARNHAGSRVLWRIEEENMLEATAPFL